MKVFKKIIYIIRIIFFIVHFIFLYNIIGTLWQVKPLIYFFFVVHFLFVLDTIIEMLSKKKIYCKDFVYNIMQIGLYLYIFTIFYRIQVTHVFFVRETVRYFNVNIGIICILLVFLLIYSHFELKKNR